MEVFQSTSGLNTIVGIVGNCLLAKKVMLESSPDLANNPLIFPPDDWTSRLHIFRATTADEDKSWSEAFTKAMGL